MGEFEQHLERADAYQRGRRAGRREALEEVLPVLEAWDNNALGVWSETVREEARAMAEKIRGELDES